ncbi:FAD-dependent oxidoreductase [Rhodobacterales bacterium HKCCE3408]|nr:FAD-dependent oxidoreductase [Rhodobacterales bacterium HKCCE3408]
MARDLLDTLRDKRFPPGIYGTAPEPGPPLRGAVRADVCIVGAGYTGLSAALHLARAGRSVVVLEAYRIGHGASGRNGGQLLGGQRVDQTELEKMLGADHAKRLWDYGYESVRLARELIETGGIDCDLQRGAVLAARRPDEVPELHEYVEHLATRYGYTEAEALDRDGVAGYVNSPVFHGGLIDHHSGHLNPFAYACGLGRLAREAGAEIHEESRVTSIDGRTVRTAEGHVEADEIVLAGNGYLGGLEPRVSARVMPINNYVVATEPLPDGAALRQRVCASDSNFVVNYFRTTSDNRLVFGGGETYGYRFPADIAAMVRKPMSRIFPHLKDVVIDDAWGGTLAITMRRMPHFARPRPGLWSASGYSGHGVSTATLAGRMIAEAIQGDSAAFDTMEAIPAPAFPGGTALRWPLLVSAMLWYGLRDRLGI